MRTISSIGAVSMILGNSAVFKTNCAIACRAAHACTYSEEFCENGVRRNPRPFRDAFNLAHNSVRLCLLEFCLSIFVVSWSSLIEVRQCRIYLCSVLYVLIYH